MKATNMKQLTSIAILCCILTLISCGAKPAKTKNVKSPKIGEFLYIQDDRIHIDRQCEAFDKNTPVERVLSTDRIDYYNYFCPRCVDDESYKALSPQMKTNPNDTL